VLAPETVGPLGSVALVTEPVVFGVGVKLRRVVGRKVGVSFVVVSSRGADVEGNGGLQCTVSIASAVGR
jgi:hypothetical protein